jgi:hypothetical protein
MREKIIRKYYVYLCLLFAAYIALAFAAAQIFYYYMGSVWLFGVSVFVSVFAVRLAHSFLGVKIFLSILLIEKDGEKFAEVLKPSKFFSPSAPYRMMAAYYGGDHAQTVNICAKMMKGKLSAAQRLLCISILARTYFELGDDAKLSAAYRYFEAYTEAMPNGEKMREKYPIMEFFGAYLRGDLSTCEEAMEKGKAEEERAYASIAEAQSKFFRAVACLRLGDGEKAQLLFDDVVRSAPKTHFARLAEKHLDAIARENLALLKNAEVLPDENYEIHGKAMRTFLKLKKPILIFLAVLALIDLMVIYLLI